MADTAKSYLDLVRTCDNFPYDDGYTTKFYRLLLPYDDRPHGYLLPSIVQKMPWNPDFKINHSSLTIQLHDSSNGTSTSTACNAAFAKVVSDAISLNLFKILSAQHSEPFLILGSNPPIQIERFAAPLFGIISRGAHATVYTRTRSGIEIWVPRRSAHLWSYPNKLDTTVAGGVRADESPFENIVHEADEEASLPADLVRRDLRSCGVLTYMSETGPNRQSRGEAGLASPAVIYLYDLEVGEDVVPKPRDEEVKEFYLWGVEEVKEALRRGEFKTNSAAVMLDFFVRHGVITGEEKDYVEIITRMHRRLPFPTAPRAG